MATEPVPPGSSYLGELSDAAQRAFLEALMAGGEMLGLSRPAVYILAAVLAAVALVLIGRLVLSRAGSGSRREEAVGSLAAGPGPAAAPRDAAGWRAELERRLAEGRIAEALEAAWWWLARSVAGEKAETDWTSRDLITRSRLQDLAPLVRRLDAFIYGPRQPAAEELRSLVARMEDALS